jgi:hypothetical protein
LRRLLRCAQADAESVASRGARVAFVTCGYDTAFEPVAHQVSGKCRQIDQVFPVGGAVQWTLWVVDDDLDQPNFAQSVLGAPVPRGTRVEVLPLRNRAAGGQKGRAILAGFAAALEDDPSLDAVVYVNLNLKVDARLAATGVRHILGGADAAVGTRSRRRGGAVYGAGTMSRVKSVVFNRLVRACLPALQAWEDTNAPMKVFSAECARLLSQSAVIPRVTMDVEWLTLLSAWNHRVVPYPVVWTQRQGSRPPWHLAVRSAADIVKVRLLWAAS